jgi:hypothetical protein
LIVRWFLLIVRRFCTARARHHSIGLPSIFGLAGVEARAALSVIGSTVVRPASVRDDKGSTAAPMAMPSAPSAPAYMARIFLFSNGMSTCLSIGAASRTQGFPPPVRQH